MTQSSQQQAEQPVPVKSGPQTTEFWTTAITTAITLIIAVGTLFDHKFSLNGAQALIPALATIAAAISTAFYSHSRSQVKAAAHAASATVLASQLQYAPAASPAPPAPPAVAPAPTRVPPVAPAPPTTVVPIVPTPPPTDAPAPSADSTTQLDRTEQSEVWEPPNPQ